MSCNDATFDKYPYVYECCPHSIEGITKQFLIDLWKEKDVEGFHIYCCECGKIYHLFKLGMKWTELIATHEEIKEYKEKRDQWLLSKDNPLKIPNEDTFDMYDVPKFICRICKKGMFENEPYEIKEKFIEDLNMTIGMLFKISKLVTKEQYIETWNEAMEVVNSCRRCTMLGKQRMNIGRYN